MAFNTILTVDQARVIVAELSTKENRTAQESARLLLALKIISNGWYAR